jgi:segregation and condensation protein B
MSNTEIRNIIEAALLAAGKSLSLSELALVFDESQRPEAAAIRTAIASLAEDYAGRPIELQESGGGFRVQVRREYALPVSRLWPERPQRYSRALLETLALIAYRQPITRAEIEAVRGVAVNPNIIKTLIERQWIRVVGHRDLPGRPELLGTTRDFLEYFSLRSLDDLPPLAQLRSLGEIDPQFELGVSGVDGPAGRGIFATAVDASDEELVESEADAHGHGHDRDAHDSEHDSEEESAPANRSGLVAAPPDGAD